MSLAIALYVGRGDWTDRLIRAVTRSPYSHVELVDLARSGPARMHCVSASMRDGGVRVKLIDVTPGHWKIVPLAAWASPQAFRKASLYAGQRYDLWGAVLGPTLGLGLHNVDRWFCSELVGWALGLPKSHALSPGHLAGAVSQINAQYSTQET